MQHHVGLTGGIGSGKSTVAAMLAASGASIIDADAISRATTGPGGAAISRIREVFGPAMLTTQGALDRDKMRTLAFSDPDAKKRLENIIHPLVGQAIAAQTQEAKRANTPCIVFDIPLLVESSHWRQSLHRVIVIDCAEETQVARVTARNGLPASDIQKIVAAQAPRARRLAAADCVLFNDGIDLQRLAHEVQEIGHQFGL